MKRAAKKPTRANEVNNVSFYPHIRNRSVRYVEYVNAPDDIRFTAWSVADDSIIGSCRTLAKLKRDCIGSGWDVR